MYYTICVTSLCSVKKRWNDLDVNNNSSPFTVFSLSSHLNFFKNYSSKKRPVRRTERAPQIAVIHEKSLFMAS